MTDADDSVRERIADNPFCETLRIELASLEPGRAETALTVEARHLNFHGTPHGGAVYALADAAFAAASNSRGETATALETNVSYLAAAAVGDRLTAVAEETHPGETRRSTVWKSPARTSRSLPSAVGCTSRSSTATEPAVRPRCRVGRCNRAWRRSRPPGGTSGK